MTAESHSICVHLAATSQQPIAVFTDDSGRESFMCMSCASEHIAAMTSSTTPGEIAASMRFDRCNHNDGHECRVCYSGITSYVSVVRTLAFFADKPLGNRLLRVLQALHRIYRTRLSMGWASSDTHNPSIKENPTSATCKAPF